MFLLSPSAPSPSLSLVANLRKEPRHAVAVAVVPKGSKRHNLLLELGEDEDLRHLLAIGALFKKGRTSLVVHRYHYDALAYEGKWTRSAISSWLQEVAFPPVNYLPQFAPTKFLTRNPFGILLVVKPGHHTPELAKALEPHAARLKDKLKVSFFARTPSTQQLCEMYGVRSSDEFLLIERPKEGGLAKGHSHVPKSPKYRVENVSAADVDLFFKQYESGQLPRYLMSSKAKAEPQIQEGLRELTGWDFLEVVQDPKVSVLVEFVSEKCEACEEFDAAYREVARRVLHRKTQRGRSPSLSRVVIARIDQSANEHTELIKGTPWLRFWPASAMKKPVEVEFRSVDTILDFLDEQEMALEDSEEEPRKRKPAKEL
ncbi:unnamed protein product [Effrenium voratum]|nr:unnamed protein product [Effrenium voratum]